MSSQIPVELSQPTQTAGQDLSAPIQFHSNNNLTKKTNFQVVCKIEPGQIMVEQDPESNSPQS